MTMTDTAEVTMQTLNPQVDDIMENRLGEYIVLSIDGLNMTVEYMSGAKERQRQTFDIKGQKKAYLSLLKERKEEAEKKRWASYIENADPKEKEKLLAKLSSTIGVHISNPMFLSSEVSTYYMLGYLATHAKLWAEMSPIYAEPFSEEYLNMTGEETTSSVYQDKWGVELRMSFTEPEGATMSQLSFPSDVNICYNAGKIAINNCRFFWRLIDCGFRIGKYQNSDLILEKIPESMRVPFKQGMMAQAA